MLHVKNSWNLRKCACSWHLTCSGGWSKRFPAFANSHYSNTLHFAYSDALIDDYIKRPAQFPEALILPEHVWKATATCNLQWHGNDEGRNLFWQAVKWIITVNHLLKRLQIHFGTTNSDKLNINYDFWRPTIKRGRLTAIFKLRLCFKLILHPVFKAVCGVVVLQD